MDREIEYDRIRQIYKQKSQVKTKCQDHPLTQANSNLGIQNSAYSPASVCGKEFGEQLLYANMLERTTGLKMHSKLQPGSEAIERFGSQRTLSHPSVSAQNGQSVQAFQILGTKGDLSGTRLWRIEGPNWLQVRPRYVQLFDPSHTLSM